MRAPERTTSPFNAERRKRVHVRVGFIGLGRMGSGMARNIAHGDHDLVVFDAYVPALETFRTEGFRTAASIAELVADAEVLFTSLSGPAQVEQVALGDDGILAHARPGQLYLDLSTNSHSLVTRAHAAFAAAGVEMLDAPVSGGPDGAASGELVLWVGGSQGAYDRALPVLESFSTPTRIGEIGAGTVTKLAHNLLGNLILESLAEVFTLGVKGGVEPLALWEALRGGLVGRRSPLDMVVDQFLPAKYDEPKMQLKLGYKDIGLAVGMGRELGVPLWLSNLVLEELTEAISRGYGELDSRAFMALQVERAGVEIAVDPSILNEVVTRVRGTTPEISRPNQTSTSNGR